MSQKVLKSKNKKVTFFKVFSGINALHNLDMAF